jgi:hypothetical protein
MKLKERVCMETTQFAIYFNDLNPNTQRRLLDTVGINRPAEVGWDISPIVIINIEPPGVDVEETVVVNEF